MSISWPSDFHVSLFSDKYMHQWPLRFLPPISPLARIDSLFATAERWYRNWGRGLHVSIDFDTPVSVVVLGVLVAVDI